MKKICLILTLFLSACQSFSSSETLRDSAVSEDSSRVIEPLTVSETEQEIASTDIVSEPLPTELRTIGGVERLYVLPINASFDVRVDTGAQTSSIDADEIKIFERDGIPYVSFVIINEKTKQAHRFEKKIEKRIRIKRTNVDEKRIVVKMEVNFMGKSFRQDFSLNDREKFQYQGIIGRNILQGNFVVDVSKENTLY